MARSCFRINRQQVSVLCLFRSSDTIAASVHPRRTAVYTRSFAR